MNVLLLSFQLVIQSEKFEWNLKTPHNDGSMVHCRDNTLRGFASKMTRPPHTLPNTGFNKKQWNIIDINKLYTQSTGHPLHIKIYKLPYARASGRVSRWRGRLFLGCVMPILRLQLPHVLVWCTGIEYRYFLQNLRQVGLCHPRE